MKWSINDQSFACGETSLQQGYAKLARNGDKESFQVKLR